ncbi:MAG: NUDIX domain-containing protein [Chitinivibrionales bacterium]
MDDLELIDVIDELGNPLNISKPRFQIHRDGDWHGTVHVWILNSHRELLLQKRSPEKESFPNLWDISCAGHIAAGQTSINAAIREVREELGVAIQEKDLVFLFTVKSRFIQHAGLFIDNEINDVYLVEKNLSFSEIHLQEEEISEIKWISIDNLKEALLSEPQNIAPHTEEYEKLFHSLGTHFSL